MSDIIRYQILCIGLDEKSKNFIKASITEAGSLHCIDDVSTFEKEFEQWQDGQFAGCFCSSGIAELPGSELAQSVQNQCPKMNKYFVTYDITKFEPSILVKNGFMNVFAMPFDAELLKRVVKEEVLINVSAQKALRSVKLFDLGADDSLDFKTFVFLPLNNKFVPFSAANEGINQNRIQKLNNAQVGSLFIDFKDMNKFYEYSANRIRALTGNKDERGSTERQAKLEGHIRSIITSIFDQALKTDFAGAKEMIENCQSIISNFITNGGSNDWYTRLMTSVGDQKDPYNHASRVSTFAALFAIGLGHPHPEDLAMAGMFHDLGMVDVPEGLLEKPESEWTTEEREIYESHPERSINYLKNKRISLPPNVEKAILQHHEKITGKGFPKKLGGARIFEDAQLLSYADNFDYLTRLEPGKKQLNPLEAHAEIVKMQIVGIDVSSRISRLLKNEGPKSESTSQEKK